MTKATCIDSKDRICAKKGIDDQVLWKHSTDGKTITFQNRTCTKRRGFWYSKEKKMNWMVVCLSVEF